MNHLDPFFHLLNTAVHYCNNHQHKHFLTGNVLYQAYTAPSTSNVTNKRVHSRLLLISKRVRFYTVYTVLALIIDECPEQQTRLKMRLFVTLDVDGAVRCYFRVVKPSRISRIIWSITKIFSANFFITVIKMAPSQLTCENFTS